MNTNQNKECFQAVIERVFNNWSGLRLVVEHGIGGRNGHKHAIEVMNYIYEYCIQNDNVTCSEIQEVLEEIMDQEFDTICEDNSIFEISSILVKFLDLIKYQKYDEIQLELNKMPSTSYWLRPEVQIKFIQNQDDSSSSDESDSDMEVDSCDVSTKKELNKIEATDDGWTVVTHRK